jgi:hypothetical protein
MWNISKIRQKAQNSVYKGKLEQILSYIDKESENRGDPQEVANLILSICGSKKPKFRYPIGKGIKRNIVFKNMLPWEWFEKFILTIIGKQRKEKT